jgi:hypothetical protein
MVVIPIYRITFIERSPELDLVSIPGTSDPPEFIPKALEENTKNLVET